MLTKQDKNSPVTPRKISNREHELRIEREQVDLTMRRLITYLFPAMFVLNLLCTFVAIFLVGFGVMTLSSTVIVSLIGETVANVGALLLIVTKYLYASK